MPLPPSLPRFTVARLLLGVVWLALLGCSQERTAPTTQCDESPGELYERRVAPLLSTDRPSTCNECHAGGLSLRDFARGTACESMACLVQAGLVNLELPEASVLLSWIRRADNASDAVSERLVAEEHNGFLEWIEHEAECRACADVSCPDAPLEGCDIRGGEGGAGADGGSFDESDDPGDCDPGTLDKLFRGTIYADRARCYPCHFEEILSADPSAPRFFSQTGGCQVGSLASQNNILARRLVDIEYPDASLLLLKPLAEEQGGIPHGGHDKFTLEGDSGYLAFRYWLRRYARCERARLREP